MYSLIVEMNVEKNLQELRKCNLHGELKKKIESKITKQILQERIILKL